MSSQARILFDNRRIDTVTLAVAPIDGVTGSVVRGGVTARIAGLGDPAIVNGSGLHVFVNLPARPHYDVEVDARAAGFPSVERFVFTPPAPLRRDVVLAPGPDYPFPAGTTLIRGVAARGAQPVAGASISARAAGGGTAFVSRSVASGAFALALRLPPLASHEAEAAVPFLIRVGDGASERSFLRPIDNGRTHSFLEPLDLAGSNEPGFFAA